MTKLLLAAGLFCASYQWNPGFAASVDAQMRTIAYKITTTLDARPSLPFGGR
jgi:hypothetical protein